ncbi:XRE family transcriptional regulator [Devosia sp. J2-20]|uniref:helix-turn-helix transcriptional regulator n=1 Tax=Devosia sp. J2-20 TaxID=3026161 RepID=UPI002499FACF|nr:XRE family transcriptional regulator [Devosia sp. J2-20]WDQ98165.1 XRE family transcriptional regulator [Devosia sp. J2-20]
MTEPLRARNQRIAPRGLNREQVSAYIGISPSTFDLLVDKGLMPAPRMLEARRVWDLHEVDQAFDILPHADPFNTGGNKAPSAVNDWN